MAICFPMIHGHLRCTQGRPYSQQSPLCSSFTGSQSPVYWIRQRSSKTCVGHCAFELSGLTFGFMFVMAFCTHHSHPAFLSFTPAVPSWEGIPQSALSCVSWGFAGMEVPALPLTCCVASETSCLTLLGLGFLVSMLKGWVIEGLLNLLWFQ